MNNLGMIDLVNIMDFCLQLQTVDTNNKQIAEIHDILQEQNKKLDKILEVLNVRYTGD